MLFYTDGPYKTLFLSICALSLQPLFLPASVASQLSIPLFFCWRLFSSSIQKEKNMCVCIPQFIGTSYGGSFGPRRRRQRRLSHRTLVHTHEELRQLRGSIHGLRSGGAAQSRNNWLQIMTHTLFAEDLVFAALAAQSIVQLWWFRKEELNRKTEKKVSYMKETWCD